MQHEADSTSISVADAPWLAVRVFSDEFGNSSNDPRQQVFGFASLVFASDQHKLDVLKQAGRNGLIGPNAPNPRARTSRKEKVVDGVLNLPGEQDVIVSVSYVDLRAPHVRKLLDHGKQSIMHRGVLCLTPELAWVPGINILWIHTAVMALSNTLIQVAGVHRQYVAELAVVYDEKSLDKTTTGIFRQVPENQFLGKNFVKIGVGDRCPTERWRALQRRVDIRRFSIESDSDDSEGALRLAHWVAWIAFRGLNPADPSRREDWIERILQTHGTDALTDVTAFVL